MKILARLKRYETYAMAHREGKNKDFVFYQLDQELNVSEPPHIHLCVPSTEKGWKGKLLRNGVGLRSVFKIKLNPDSVYTKNNLVLLDDYENEGFNQYKKEIIDWLNYAFRDLTRGQQCLIDYLKSNGFGSFRNEYLEEAKKIMDINDVFGE